MSKRIKKKKNAARLFDSDVTSLEEIPSINTSLNDAEKVSNRVSCKRADRIGNEAADRTSVEISGASLGEVLYREEAAAEIVDMSGSEAVGGIAEVADGNVVPAATEKGGFGKFCQIVGERLYTISTAVDDRLEKFRSAVMEALEFRKHIFNASEKYYRWSSRMDDELEKFRKPVLGVLEVRRHAYKASENLYQRYIQMDDNLEGFRSAVLELVGALNMVGGLAVHRAAHEAGRITGAHRHSYGVVRVDKILEHKVERFWDELMDGQFADYIHKLILVHRRILFRSDSLSEAMHGFSKKVYAGLDQVIGRAASNKRRWSVCTGAVLGCFMLFCVTVNAGTVYNYYYHGTELGTVKDKAAIETAVDQLDDVVADAQNIDVNVKAEPDVDITYEKQISFSAALDSAQDAVDKIAGCDELEGQGFAIKVNGQVVALVDTQETADNVLRDVKISYCTVGSPEAEAAMEAEAAAASVTADTNVAGADSSANVVGSESVDASSSATPDESGLSAEEKQVAVAAVRQLVLQNGVSQGTDIVAAAASTVASNAVADVVAFSKGIDYSVVDYTALDPSLLEGVCLDNVNFKEDVVIEQVTAKVSLFNDYDSAKDLFLDEEGNSKLLTVVTTELEVYDDEVDFETTYEDSDEIYEGETQVKREGVKGVKQVIAEVVKEDGQETSRTILQEIVTTEPQDKIILRGTKEKPSWAATGHFITPASGRFSSGFGRRWGRSHQGIDIAGSYGSTIVASDGGTVTFAGYNSSGYGYLVKIDHGNGMETYYAHNSSLLVSVGDKVYQGQAIAKMGSTGRSTGNHCHFEIHVGGTAVNPMTYL